MGLTFTVEQRERVEARAAQQERSLSSYVAKVIVEAVADQAEVAVGDSITIQNRRFLYRSPGSRNFLHGWQGFYSPCVR